MNIFCIVLVCRRVCFGQNFSLFSLKFNNIWYFQSALKVILRLGLCNALEGLGDNQQRAFKNLFIMGIARYHDAIISAHETWKDKVQNIVDKFGVKIKYIVSDRAKPRL